MKSDPDDRVIRQLRGQRHRRAGGQRLFRRRFGQHLLDGDAGDVPALEQRGELGHAAQRRGDVGIVAAIVRFSGGDQDFEHAASAAAERL